MPPNPEARVPDRIALVDLSMQGARHGPFNAMLLQVVQTALPAIPVTFWAEASHADSVRALRPEADLRATFRPIRLYPRHPGHDELVTLDRLQHDVRTLLAVVRTELRHAASGRVVLVVSCLAATGLVAAGIVQRLLGPRLRVQFVLHGNLASLRGGWRPRNPLHRALSLPVALRRAPGPGLRLLVLEETVAAALAREIPAIAGRVDVLPHPANAGEPPGPDTAHEPPRVALVGLATKAKGAEAFLRLARTLHQDGLKGQDCDGRIELRLVGRFHADLAHADLGGLAEPPFAGAGASEMDRARFVALVRAQDYVCLPYGGAYYELAASGSLLDAISCARPVVALEGALLRSLFAEFGDIGHLCADEAAMLDTLRRLAAAPDPARYAAQVQAMTRVRHSRLPETLAVRYRQHLTSLEVP